MSISCTSVGPCGLYCGSCPIYLARFYPKLKAQMAEELHCKEEEVVCNGCRELTEKCWGRHCKIRLCAENQDVQYCRACPQAPCDRVKRLSMGYWDMPEQQLQELEQMGEGEFLKLMQQRWTCTCGHPISAQSFRCVACKKEIGITVTC